MGRVPGGFGVRRPDRSVSLGDVRDLPVQAMGLPQPGTDTDVWYYGGHGNPPVMQTSPGAEDATGEFRSGFNYWEERGWPKFVAAVEATAGTDDASAWVATRPSDDPDAVEGAYGYPGFFEITADGKVREVAKPDAASGRNDPANPYWEELRGRLNPPEPVHDRGASSPMISQGLSDADRRLVEQPSGGFMPSPPMPNILPGASLQPPRSPAVGGFQASPPLSGMLPGAPIRGPQLPTVLSRGGQDDLVQQQAIRDALLAIAAAGGGAAALGGGMRGFGGGGMLRGMGSGLGAFR